MRKLMWFVIGFTSACALGVYLLSGIWYILIGLFCLLGAVSMLFLPAKPAKIAAVTLFGCLAGFSWLWGYDCLYLSNARVYDGETVHLTVTAGDYNFSPGYGQAFDGTVDLDGISYQVRCYLNEDITVSPGDVVQGEFQLRYTADGGMREPTYHQGKGIFLLASQKADMEVTVGSAKWFHYPAIWRHKILLQIEKVFPVDTSPFAKALLLGESTDFTYQQDRAFQVSGLRHVIAVSGLHVSILFAIIYMVFGRQRVLNAIFGIPLLFVFAAIAGFTPSIVRACIMQTLMLMAMLVDKEYDPPTALAFAVLVILGVNPRAITSVSFQLSVGCMIGIFAFSEPLRKYFLSFGNLQKKGKGKGMQAKLIRWFFGSVSITLSAMVVTTPLCAIYFGMVSLIGILANLLTLWIISFVFYGVMVACLFSLIWVPLGQTVAWLISWPVRYVLLISDVLSSFPLAAVYTDSIYIIFWLIFAYLLLTVFFLIQKKHPAMIALCIAAMLCVCVGLSWLEPKLDDTRISVINVGQGQSVLLQQEDAFYLVDCGGSYAGITADAVSNYLLSQGIFRLDGVILTHYDADHAGSVVNLLSFVDAEHIYMPDLTDSNGIRENIEKTYPECIELVCDVTELDLQDGKITLFPGKTGADDNESSMCVLFQSENCDILITGDRSSAGERALMKKTQLPKLEILVAGHHGSHNATSFELLAATQPQAVVISVDANNPYGHPRQEMLDRVSRFGCEVYRTDLQGTIIFRR